MPNSGDWITTIKDGFPTYPVVVMDDRVIITSDSFEGLEYPDRVNLFLQKMKDVDMPCVELFLMTPEEVKFLTLEGDNTAQMIWNPQGELK